MLLAFYKVDNSRDYGRHEFDDIIDDRDAVIDRLNLLKEDEFRCYETRVLDGCFSGYDLNDFQEDYNDEMFDYGQWWCVVI